MTERRASARYWRRLYLASRWLLAVGLTFLWGTRIDAVPVMAETPVTAAISLTASVGFAGYYSESYWIPVTVVVHNVGHPVTGELTLSVNGSVGNGRVQDGRLSWPIDIPSGWRTYTIAVPGTILGKPSAPELDCVVDGQQVQPAYLTGNRIQNNDLVAVLSAETNTAQFLTGTTGPGVANNPVLPIAIEPSLLPESANLLDSLTAVVATPDALLRLAPPQRNALWTWVRMGGLLLVTGIHWGDTKPVFPIIAGPPKWVGGAPLVVLSGGEPTPLHSLQMDGEGLRAGAKLVAGTVQQPLIAAMSVGRGNVVQTSFDPTQNTLLKWPGNVALWTTLLTQMNNENLAVDKGLLNPAGMMTLGGASDALAPLRIPSLTFWGIVFGGYIILIGPVVFFILRRLRRQSLAWGILPALSLITTISIYMFGESQRPAGVLTEGVAVLDLLGNSAAESYGIAAFMSPTTVSASASADQPALLLPLAEQGVRHIGSAVVTQTPKHSSIRFDNVGRWGVRYLYSAGTFSGQGQLDGTLDSTYAFTGTLQNNTKYALHDVAVFWNNKMFPVGDMKPGQVVNIQEPETFPELTQTWLMAYSNYNRSVARGIGRTLSNYSAPLVNLTLNQNEAMILATTAQRGPALPTLFRTVASSNTLTLVRQFVSVANYPLG